MLIVFTTILFWLFALSFFELSILTSVILGLVWFYIGGLALLSLFKTFSLKRFVKNSEITRDKKFSKVYLLVSGGSVDNPVDNYSIGLTFFTATGLFLLGHVFSMAFFVFGLLIVFFCKDYCNFLLGKLERLVDEGD
jgi:hypothetical protein